MKTIEQRLARLRFQLWSLKVDAEVAEDSGFGVSESLKKDIQSFTCAVAALEAQLAK
jgi:hypothetical protein